MNGKLTNVRCEYTGGGIYLVTAKYEDVWLVSDLETYGTYDIPYDQIDEVIGFDYDGHWKDSSVPLPTWGELYRAITRSYRHGDSPNMDQGEVFDILYRNHPRLSLRLDQRDDAPRTDSERKILLCDIIEAFEDFLEEKGIDIPNSEKEQDPDASNIYGTDYGNLSDDIEAILIRYDTLKEEV